MEDSTVLAHEDLVQKLEATNLLSHGTTDELLRRYNIASDVKHAVEQEYNRTWPIHTYQLIEQLRYRAEQISRLESLVMSLQKEKMDLQNTVRALQVSQDAIFQRLSLLENTPQRLRVPPTAASASVPSTPTATQADVTPTPPVQHEKSSTPKIPLTFAAVAARSFLKPRPPPDSEDWRKVRPIIRGTRKADERTITANPLEARGLPSRDFAIRGVPRHVTAAQLTAYLEGLGVKPRFVRIVPVGPDDTKSSTVGRIGVSINDVDPVLKAENWPSNITITPWKFGL